VRLWLSWRILVPLLIVFSRCDGRLQSLDSLLVCLRGIFVMAKTFDTIQKHDENTTKTYQQAIQALQSAITATENQITGANGLKITKASPFLCATRSMYPRGTSIGHAMRTYRPLAYIDLVAQRKGEALVILAHFGALVDRHKHSWVFCDGGKSSVQHLPPSGIVVANGAILSIGAQDTD
jgi:hypothetical protein